MGEVSYDDRRATLEHIIDRDQEELREAVHELSEAARAEFDLSEWIKDYPWAWIAGGFLIGVWLGRRRRRHVETLDYPD